MSERTIIDDTQPIPPANSLSVYNDKSMDDFPVLKAFQQYLDAEQAKARKRMVGLCAFFVILMVIVIGVFLVMLNNVQIRNQALNDRLLGMVAEERQKPVVAAAHPVPVAAATPTPELRAITDTLQAMQKEMSDRKADEIKQAAEAAKAAAAAAKAAVEKAQHEKATAVQVLPQPVSASAMPDSIHDRKLKAERERLEREQMRLIEEKARLKIEREKFRQEEIERQRRKLYPEYYQKLDEKNKEQQTSKVRQTPAATRKPNVTTRTGAPTEDDGPTMKVDPKTGAITYFEEEDEELENLVKELPKRKAKPRKPEVLIQDRNAKPESAKPENAKPAPSQVKVEVRGKAANWLIPIE